MPSNTTFNPSSIWEFEKSKLNYAAKGCATTVSFGTTVNLDLRMTDDVLLTGAWVITKSSTFGDTASLQVVDVDGILAPAGTVLATFVSDWYMVDDVNVNVDIQYPAKILSGLYLRLKYTSTGLVTVKVAANWKLHKVLV